jgi:hypothetical protein
MELLVRRTGIYLISFALAIAFFKVNGFFSNRKSEIIKSDGLGYYSYLPALFIYGDSSQDFVKEKFPKYYKNTGIPEYMQIIDNKPVDKYFFGTAVLMYPFFMTAHWLSYHYHQPPDGYSILYQYLIGLAAVFYVFLGIFFCDKLLRLYGASTWQSMFICCLLVFATNIFFYAVVESTMSHDYSFAMVSAFLYFTKSIFENKKTSHIIPAFISLGLIVLIRPFNGLIILAIPFLAGSWTNLKEGLGFLLNHYFKTIVGILAAALFISLQLLIWYKQTGHFLVYSYTYERFYFNKPNILNVLFSYRKGLFIYTPLLFISLTGLIWLFRNNKFQMISFITFFFILVYIMSCWHQWYYGASFGFRPMIEYFPLFAILLLLSFRLIKNRKWKYIFIGICFCSLLFNQVQAYQYRNFILHWEHMSRYKYWRVFLKTDPKWNGYVWNNPEPSDIVGTTVLEYQTDFEKPDNGWNGASTTDVGKEAYSGKMSGLLDANNEYGNTLIINGSKKLNECKKPAMIFSGYLRDKNRFASDKLQVIISYDKAEGGTYYYAPRLIDNFVDNKNGWKKFEVALRIDTLRTEKDIIKIYLWNQYKETFLIDDLDVKFVEQL